MVADWEGGGRMRDSAASDIITIEGKVVLVRTHRKSREDARDILEVAAYPGSPLAFMTVFTWTGG